MKSFIKKIISFALTLTVFGASANVAFAGITQIHLANNFSIDTSQISIPVTETLGEKDWTVAIYLCGSDLETQSGCVTNDLIEMLEAKIPDNINVIVMTGGTKGWNPNGAAETAARAGLIGTDAYITPDSRHTQIYSIDDDRMNLIYTSANNLNMSDPSVAAAFLEFAYKYAPAKHTMALFWDHGGGPLIGAENDEYTGEIMSVKEIAAAVKAARDTTGGKLDIVGFDACYMSNIETASLLAPYADYLIAAEGDEPTTGWDYSWLNIFDEMSAVDTSVEIGKRIIDLCPALTKNGWAEAKDVVLAMTDLSKMSDIKDDVDALGKELLDSLSDAAKHAKITRAAEELSSFSDTGLIDLYEFAYKMRGTLYCADSIISAVGTPPTGYTGTVNNGAVVYRGASPDHINCVGLAVYYPTSGTFIGNSPEDTNALMDIYKSIGLGDAYIKYIQKIVLKTDEGLGAFEGEMAIGYNGDENRFTMTVKDPDDILNMADVQVITKYTGAKTDGTSVTYRLGTRNADEDWDNNYFENPSDGTWGTIGGEYFSYDVTRTGEYLQYKIPVITSENGDISIIVAYAAVSDPYDLEIDKIYAPDSDPDAQNPYLPLYVLTFSTLLLEDSEDIDYSSIGYLKNSEVSITRESGSERYLLKIEPSRLQSDDNGTYTAYFKVLDMLGNSHLSDAFDITLLNRADYFFKDIASDDWFVDSVTYMFVNGLMDGTSYRIFSPYMPLTRGMIAQIVYRAEGSPKFNSKVSFPDVAADKYYATAIAWAQDKGIVNGFDAEHYAPDIQITREQLVKILYYYASYRGADMSAYKDASYFADYSAISDYALTPIGWALGKEIIKGRTNSELAPTAQVTRAETAAMFERFFKTIN